MISVSQLTSLTPKTRYKIDVQPVNCDILIFGALYYINAT